MENEIKINLDENIIFYNFIKNIENNKKNFYNKNRPYNLNDININEFLNNFKFKENLNAKNLNNILLNKINLIQQINFEDKFIINFELVFKIFEYFDIFFQDNYKLNNCKVEYYFYCINNKIFTEKEIENYYNLFKNNELDNDQNNLANNLINIFNNNQNETIYLPIDEIINFCYYDNNEKDIKSFIIKIKNFINEIKKNINIILNSNELIFIKKIKFTISQDYIETFEDFENIENFKSKFILFYYN